MAHTAPNFKRVHKDKHKVALDARFSAVLTDERFSVPAAKYDKYGRKQSGKKSAKDELSAFYTLEEGGGDIDDAPESDDNVDYDELYAAEAALEDNKDKSEASKARGLKPKPKVIKRQKFKPGEALPPSEMERRLAHLNRMARGELESGDDSDSSDDSSDGASSDGGGEGGDSGEGSVWAAAAGPPQTAELPSGGETRRLAVCNLDWDHLAAVDVFKLMESFVPAGGAVLKVAVYPSNYGLEKLAHEARFGPKLWQDGGGGHGQFGDEDDKEGSGSDEDEDGEADDEARSGERLGRLDGGDGGTRKQVGIVFADGSSDEDSDEDDGDEFEVLPAPRLGARSKGSRVQVAVGYGKTQDFDEDALRR
jgi:hypothetical protein